MLKLKTLYTRQHDVICQQDANILVANSYRHHDGSPKMRFKVEHNDDGSITKIEQVKTKNANGSSHIYTLKKIYYVNNSSSDVRKIISSLFGITSKQCQYETKNPV